MTVIRKRDAACLRGWGERSLSPVRLALTRCARSMPRPCGSGPRKGPSRKHHQDLVTNNISETDDVRQR